MTGTTSVDHATPARVLFQLLIAGARRSIRITATYSCRTAARGPNSERPRAAACACRSSCPAFSTTTPIDRQANWRRYGDQLRASVEMLEHEPGMSHCMVLNVDEIWVVVELQQHDGHGDSSVPDVVILERSAAVCSAARNRPGPESVVDYRGVVDADQTAIAPPTLF